MTVQLSLSKVKKLLKYYFSGLPQPAIAGKLGISQGTVSNWADRFRNAATEKGLLETAEGYDMYNVVNELRTLSIELNEADLTVGEARDGVDILKKFKQLGVHPEAHEALIKVCKSVNDPGFVNAAVKLSELEASSGIEYEEAIPKYKKAVQELPLKESELESVALELEAATHELEKKKKDLAKIEKGIDTIGQKVKENIAEYEHEISEKLKEFQVKQMEIEQVAQLKEDLVKHGLDIPTLIKIAEEFNNGEDES